MSAFSRSPKVLLALAMLAAPVVVNEPVMEVGTPVYYGPEWRYYHGYHGYWHHDYDHDYWHHRDEGYRSYHGYHGDDGYRGWHR